MTTDGIYIIPYLKINHQKNSIFSFYTTSAFLVNKGHGVWKTDEKKPSISFIIHEYLEPNGLTGICKLVNKNILLVEIDPKNINLDNFYSYLDGSNAEEIWRTFYMVPNAGWEEEAEKESLGKFGSVKKLWDLILNNP